MLPRAVVDHAEAVPVRISEHDEEVRVVRTVLPMVNIRPA
ncbi:hypothetical protein ARTSIC4J27_464 [Pseudarthrobacter siccitolerans]|uniref:Uncharacterized protein n=1 Tax=Pseudarthrobacter siccitolerans TaxID=861266 RepID=A0A024GXS1_9MICC|nr:hypothetical protein ARTSIC4J27_464 [Pseudarthrobacter siccitolerans]